MQKLMMYSTGLVILFHVSSCALLDSWGICRNDGSILGCAVDDLVSDAGESDAGGSIVKNPDGGGLVVNDPDGGIDEPVDAEILLAREFPRWPILSDPPASTYQDNGNGTITDKTTGLIWEKEIIPDSLLHAQAIAYCDGLILANQSDWRLPTRTELRSLVNHSLNNPASTFPNISSDFFWSSTPVAGDPDRVWLVFFLDGVASNAIGSSFSARVRCVR